MIGKEKYKILHNPHRKDVAVAPHSDVVVTAPEVLDSDESVIELESVQALAPDVIEPEIATAQ